MSLPLLPARHLTPGRGRWVPRPPGLRGVRGCRPGVGWGREPGGGSEGCLRLSRDLARLEGLEARLGCDPPLLPPP